MTNSYLAELNLYYSLQYVSSLRLKDFVSISSYLFQVINFELSDFKQTSNLQLWTFNDLHQKKNIQNCYIQIT